MMHTTIRRNLAGAAVLATMLTACGSSSTSPSAVTTTRSIAPVSPVASSPAGASSDVPSASVSSSASSGTPTASPSASGYDPALVAEAEKVFREYQAAFIKWQQRGGSATLPSEFNAWSMPPIEQDLADLLSLQKRQGWRLESSPEPRVVVLGPLSGISMNGSSVAIRACVDATDTHTISADGTRTKGVVIQYRAFFKRTDTGLKLVNEQNRQGAKCE